MIFKQLIIKDWKQFQDIEINFHPKLTVISGSNGSGKTTILNILGKHFGWDFQELSTPAKEKKSGLFKFFPRFFKYPRDSNDPGIGKLTYDNKAVANLNVPISSSKIAPYEMVFANRQPVKGLYIPSHRPAFNYMPISQIPTKKRKKIDAYNLVFNSYKQKILGQGGPPSNFHIKETLLSWAYCFGNEIIEADPEQIEYFRGFEIILKKILPKVLGFKKFAIRMNEIVLITDTGDFMLDAVSGGVSNLIDLAWQIYMYSTKESTEVAADEAKKPQEDKKHMVVLIDEVENHLHATLQRAILPDLLNAFPDTQFIVATHNPLIVGSVAESNVYVLSFNENNKVVSRSLDLVNKAKTATQILREILGVPFSMPIWAEEKLQGIISRYISAEINKKIFKKIREELAEIGLEDLMPEVVSKFFEKTKNND